MDIEFVNHSSFVVHSGPTQLMIDPWIEGRVFNQGWDLIAKSVFDYSDFGRITHIWFSHEHPDHFHPPSLSKIPEQIRRGITVLFQQTIDKRVVDYCTRAGFREVIEMAPGQWLSLGPAMDVLCEHYENGDSWIAVRGDGRLLLNTNDCGMRDARRIEALKARLGAIDLLATQFSYAYWLGNEDDVALRQAAARQKMVDMKLQIDILRPADTLPIASFVKFCHAENRYLNDSINTAQTVCDFIAEETASRPIAMYPGDRWTVGEAHDNGPAQRRYAGDYDRVRAGQWEAMTGRPVTLDQLTEQAAAFAAEMRRRAGPIRHFLPPARIHIWDFGSSFTLSAKDGLAPCDTAREACDIELSADSLLLCLKEPWGADTLGINGRYRRPPGGNYARFHNIFRVLQLVSRGIRVDAAYVGGAVWRKAAAKLKSRWPRASRPAQTKSGTELTL